MVTHNHQKVCRRPDGVPGRVRAAYPGGVSDVQQVPIRDESIRLGQLLKLSGVVSDGAMARMVVENGEVTVDGAVLTRRGTQIRPGMVVAYQGQSLTPTRSP